MSIDIEPCKLRERWKNDASDLWGARKIDPNAVTIQVFNFDQLHLKFPIGPKKSKWMLCLMNTYNVFQKFRKQFIFNMIRPTKIHGSHKTLAPRAASRISTCHVATVTNFGVSQEFLWNGSWKSQNEALDNDFIYDCFMFHFRSECLVPS